MMSMLMLGGVFPFSSISNTCAAITVSSSINGRPDGICKWWGGVVPHLQHF